MTVSSVWFLDKIVLPSSVEIQALNNARLDAGITSLMEHGAGEVHPNFIATQVQRPTIPFSTPSLNTLLANVPLIGASIATGTMYLKKGALTGRVARATASHYKVACTTACIYWTSIRLPHNGVGTADVVIVPIYDGTNAPFIYTGSVALSGTVSSQNYFGAGPVYLNNVAYTDIQEITINSGVELYELGGASEVYNTAVGIRIAQPSIEVRAFQPINFATIGFSGLAINATYGVVAYGRQYAADGNRTADTTATHVGVSIPAGRVIPLNTSGDGPNVVSDLFRVEARYHATPDTSMKVSGATKIDGDENFQNL